jgi:hypothetical protein
LSALKLVDDFAHLASKSFQSGDYEAKERYRLQAERSYLEAKEMLDGLAGVDTGSLETDLMTRRKALDELGKRNRSASA